MIAQALVRLGQGSGVNELMWQLRAGTNNTKAEVMAFLVGITGEPLGQDVDAWWAYLHEHGRIFLARRPGGTPAVVALQGVGPRGGPARLGPFLFAQRPFTWQQVPAVVIRLEPTLGPISRALLEKHEQVAGKLADGCLLLIHTRWQEAKTSPPAPAPSGKGAVSGVPPTPPAGPTTAWLEPEALRYLLQQAPRLLGVAIDTPSLDPPGAAHPLRDQLLAGGRLAIESLGDMDRLLPRSSRLLLFAGAPTATILALLP
jgi:kynurenine formamidase